MKNSDRIGTLYASFMVNINDSLKNCASLPKLTSNFVPCDKDIYNLKNMYDLQVEILCKKHTPWQRGVK
jgi:hypothetical protein